MAQPELDSLIVRHLADLDRATQRIQRLQADVFEALKKKTETWCEKNGWYSEFSLDQESQWPAQCWLAPTEWHTADSDAEGAFDAWMTLGVGHDDTEQGTEGEDYWFLTRLCGVGAGQTLFRFETEMRKGRKWKQFFPQMADLVKDTLFAPDPMPSFVLPVRLDADALARAILDEDLQAALAPYTEGLEGLRQSEPAFTKVVQQLRSEKNVSSLTVP